MRSQNNWIGAINKLRDSDNGAIGEQLHELSVTANSMCVSLAYEPLQTEYHQKLLKEMQSMLDLIEARMKAI